MNTTAEASEVTLALWAQRESMLSHILADGPRVPVLTDESADCVVEWTAEAREALVSALNHARKMQGKTPIVR